MQPNQQQDRIVAVPPGGAAAARPPASQYSGWNFGPCGPAKQFSSKCGCQTFFCCLCFFVFMLLILVPMSVVRVAVSDYALPKRRSTSTVLTGPNDLWENGEHWVGPDFVTQVVPSRITVESMDLAPFVKNSGNELPVKFKFFWRQTPSKIHSNFIRFGDHLAVSTRLRTQLEVAVKGVSASSFELNDYIVDIAKVRKGYIYAISEALKNIKLDIEIHGLYFTQVQLPDQVIQSSLQSAILSESEVIKVIERNGTLISAETETMRRQIVADTKLVETQGAAESSAIVKTAQAEANAIAQGAEGRGLALFFNALNVTDLGSKAAWQRYLAILRKTNI